MRLWPSNDWWDKEAEPLTRKQGFLLMCMAITVAAAISICASLISSANSDQRQDEDFATLCQTSKRIAGLNAARLRNDSEAFREAAALLIPARGPGVTPRTPALGELFLVAAIGGDVVADIQEDFVRADCQQLPPLTQFDPESLRATIDAEIARRLEEDPLLRGR